MVTQVRDDRAIDDFARNVGEWLLAQRIGGIVPCSYRHRLWLPPPDDPDDLPHVTIELTVEDWHSPDVKVTELKDTYPPAAATADLERATVAYAMSQKPPSGLHPGWPVSVTLFTCSDVEETEKRRRLD